MSDTRTGLRCPHHFNAAHHVLYSGHAPETKIALAILSVARSERWSYQKLRQAVIGMAHALLASGVKPGEVVLLRLGHSADFPVAFLGAIWAGILPLPTSDQLSEDEITHIADAADPAAILFDEGIDLPRSGARRISVRSLDRDSEIWTDPQSGAPDRPAYIMCTSGTSDRPRLVRHAHRAIWARRFVRSGWADMGGSDRVLHSGAFNWSYTLGTGLLDPWTSGGTALVMAAGSDWQTLPLLAKRHDATILASVPGIFRRLSASELPRMPRLRHALSAGEKLPQSVRERWIMSTGVEIHEAFGQTECSTFISGSPARPAPPDTLGFAQPGRAIAIVENGDPLPLGESGEIAVSADDPGLCIGNSERTGAWIGTGDRGRMNQDGSVQYLGRNDDILTAGGYRIAPIEIEHAYQSHPDIIAAAAFDYSVDDETRIIALCYLADRELDPEALKEHGRARLAAYKVPRQFKRVKALPTGANGKLLRRALGAATDSAS